MTLVIPGRKRPYKQLHLTDFTFTAIIISFAVALCELLYRLGIDGGHSIIVVVLSVLIVAAGTNGYFYGLIAAVSGVFAHDFFIAPPRFDIYFSAGFLLTLSVMLSTAFIIGSVTARIKSHMEEAKSEERRAELLYEINRKLLSSRDEASIARYAIDFLKDELRRSVALYTSFDDENPSCYFRQSQGDVTSEFFTSGKEYTSAVLAARHKEPFRSGGPTSSKTYGYYFPAITQGAVYGVFGFSCLSGSIPPHQHAFIELIVEQAAQALHVQSLAVRQREAHVMAETEKTRNSFLRGISHDLRTPLTSIIGASSTFLENREQLSPDTQIQLVQGIYADSQWLLSMVKNILSVTRIHQNKMVIKKTEELAEEVVAEAVSLFRGRYPKVKVSIRQPESVLLADMDALLITQVINNFLDNAHRHAGGDDSEIVVEICENNGFAEISVTDSGSGIPDTLLPSLFDAKSIKWGHTEDASRGLGIGLSLCKTIVDVHGGWINACNLPQGGARFAFGLPMTTGEENFAYGE